MIHFSIQCIGASKIDIHSPYFPATGIFKSCFFSFSRLFKFSVKTKQWKILVKYKKSSSRTKQELSEVAIFHRTCKNKERRRPNFVKIKWKIQAFSTARTDKWEKWLTSYKLFHMYSPIGKEFHSVGLYWGFV